MHATLLRRTIRGGAVAGLAAVTVLAPTGSALAAGWQITPVHGLSGLAAPRGIAFDGRGTMYLAQSGLAGSGSAGLTHTGSVSAYPWGSSTPAWTTRFDSLYATEDPTAPPDVLGPEGISAFGRGCMLNSHGRRNGCQVRMIMSESTDGVAGEVAAPQAGHLFRLDGATGAATDLADVGDQQYAWTSEHTDLFPSDFPDSNPYGVLVTKDPTTEGVRTYVADAGANTVSEVMGDGSTRVVSYIPNETSPPFRDSTPTCIAEGPDGYLYVGALDFVSNLIFPGTGGTSSVWRVNPNASWPTAPQRWATGLTTLTGCTFDRSGNFWATEMFAGGFAATRPGDVVTMPFAHPAAQTHIGAGQLAVPGGIAQGPDDAMYVTVGSSAPGTSGAVMRISQH